MKNINKIILGLAVVITTLAGCLSPSDYPIEPVISFEGFSKNTLKQGSLNEDTVTLIINFTDGDGDIGFNQLNISVFDNRLADTQVPRTFIIPEIPEQGVQNGISGKIAIQIFSSCCFQGSISCEPFPDMPEDEISYRVIIRDKAGNASNELITPSIRLLCI